MVRILGTFSCHRLVHNKLTGCCTITPIQDWHSWWPLVSSATASQCHANDQCYSHTLFTCKWWVQWSGIHHVTILELSLWTQNLIRISVEATLFAFGKQCMGIRPGIIEVPLVSMPQPHLSLMSVFNIHLHVRYKPRSGIHCYSWVLLGLGSMENVCYSIYQIIFNGFPIFFLGGEGCRPPMWFSLT